VSPWVGKFQPQQRRDLIRETKGRPKMKNAIRQTCWSLVHLVGVALIATATAADSKPVFECNFTHRFDMFDAEGRETEVARNWLKRAPRASFDTASGLLRRRDATGMELSMLQYRIVAEGDKKNDWVAVSTSLPHQWFLRIRTWDGVPFRIMLTEAGMVSIGTCK
jgi:hypothetical protein